MKILNKRANFDYEILETVEAGIALKGEDLKNFREGKANLRGAYAKITDGEVYLLSSTIPTRKLLLHKAQIVELQTKIKAKKLTLVPTKLYNKGHLVKVELALAKSKREFEKRDTAKKKDLARESQTDI